MSETLRDQVAAGLDAAVAEPVRAIAARLAGETQAVAVLFYGSNLRTRSLDGVLDFYVLTDGPPERGLWPTVSYREFPLEGQTLRVKIATMRAATFHAAASGDLVDTTIWTRFVQPAALAWVRDAGARHAVVDAIAAAVVTAARFAAALGPAEGTAEDYWRALFRQTYAAELRVERPGREEQIIAHGAGRYQRLLPLAWDAAGIAFTRASERLIPSLPQADRIRRAWRRRRRLGKPLNIARLVRAAFTFEGAAAYGAWKVERHTGVAVTLTPWRTRHPVLAAPAVLWQVWRQR